MKQTDISIKIERVEELEKRLSIQIKSLSAILHQDEDYQTIKILGELVSINGENLQSDIEIIASLYDNQNRIVGTDSTQFYTDEFFQFETFSLSIEAPSLQFSKIRVHPKKR